MQRPQTETSELWADMNLFSNWDLTYSVTVVESWLTPLGFGILSLGKAQLLLELWSGWLLKWAARFPWFHAAPLCSANKAHGNAVAARQTFMTYIVHEQMLWKTGCSSWLHHTESFISDRFRMDKTIQEYSLFSPISPRITRFKKYIFSNNDS